MYATGLISQNENNGNGSGTGYGFQRVGKIGATTGAPTELRTEWASFSSGFHGYSYLSDTQSFSNTGANGLLVSANTSNQSWYDLT